MGRIQSLADSHGTGNAGHASPRRCPHLAPRACRGGVDHRNCGGETRFWRLWRGCGADCSANDRREVVRGKTLSDAGLDRRKVVAALLEQRGALLVVAGLGSAAWDCTAAGDHPLTFPLWGAMGSACMIGLCLALAQSKRRVLVVTGDGEILMGLGSLPTVGAQRPGHLAVVVRDDERYGETGMQKTHTAYGTDLAAVARACRFATAPIIRRNPQGSDVRSGI